MGNSEKLEEITRTFCHGKRQELAEKLGISTTALYKWFYARYYGL